MGNDIEFGFKRDSACYENGNPLHNPGFESRGDHRVHPIRTDSPG